VRNHTAAGWTLASRRVEALVVSPYASGLSCLVEDEIGPRRHRLSTWAGGTTTIGVFFRRESDFFADYVPVGGMHVTNDIARRALDRGSPHAERMKTLFGHRDFSEHRRAREMIAVPQNRRGGRGARQPCAEISARRHHRAAHRGGPSSWVRNRLEASGFRQGRRPACRADRAGACQFARGHARCSPGLILE